MKFKNPHRLIRILLPLLILSVPSVVFGWGAGMHATLNAQGYHTTTSRWAKEVDANLFIYASNAPDFWYMMSDPFIGSLCHIACGPDNGSMSNECFNDYDPLYYYSYARHLIVNASSIPAVSWALGYAGHQVGDYRGHLEYIIPGWRNPTEPDGLELSRHTFIDSAGGALVFNVEGLFGYPTGVMADKAIYGYPHEFLTDQNAETVGGRDTDMGLAVSVIKDRKGNRKVQWMGILNPEKTGADPQALLDMIRAASLSSASEGILALGYGVTAYDISGREFPIIVQDGKVAIDCSTDLAQRMEGENGFGEALACQINLATVSGLAQWDDYIKPADETSQEIVVNREKVAEWLEKIARNYERGGVYMDDVHVFELDEQGISQATIYGVDGQEYTYGRPIGEIVSGVLERNVRDIAERLLNNPGVLGMIFQSRLSLPDKARFLKLRGTDFGLNYPRLSAWPGGLPYAEQTVVLAPEAPGPFATYELPLSFETYDPQRGDEWFNHYVYEVTIFRDTLHGTGTLTGTVFGGEEAERDDAAFGFTVNLETMTLEGADERVRLAEVEETDPMVDAALQANVWRLSVKVSAKDRAFRDDQTRLITLRLALNATDAANPPYDLILRSKVLPFCDEPDWTSEPGDPATPCAEPPSWPDREIETEEGETETEIESETTESELEGDADPEEIGLEDGDETSPPTVKKKDGGCASIPGSSGAFLLGLGLMWGWARARRKANRR